MGAEPYWYFVEYQSDIDGALQELRKREFEAGRYNPVMDRPMGTEPFSPTMPLAWCPQKSGQSPNSPAPGAQHKSIEEAIEDADADGTRSILDIMRVAEEPDFCVAAPLSEVVLDSLFGTTQPTRQMIDENMDFWDDLERGHCIYIVAYKDGKPDEIFGSGSV
jgi:hypothetical protein